MTMTMTMTNTGPLCSPRALPVHAALASVLFLALACAVQTDPAGDSEAAEGEEFPRTPEEERALCEENGLKDHVNDWLHPLQSDPEYWKVRVYDPAITQVEVRHATGALAARKTWVPAGCLVGTDSCDVALATVDSGYRETGDDAYVVVGFGRNMTVRVPLRIRDHSSGVPFACQHEPATVTEG